VTWITTAFNMRVANRRLAHSLLEAAYVRRREAILAFLIGAPVIIGFTEWFFWTAVSSVIETVVEFFSLFSHG
jgi:hypothetical protein